MMDNDKYATMLMELADARPEMKDDIMALHDELLADGEDVGGEPMAPRAPMDEMDEEAENEPSLAPRPDKGRIPPELMDDEEEDEPAVEIEMMAPRRGRK